MARFDLTSILKRFSIGRYCRSVVATNGAVINSLDYAGKPPLQNTRTKVRTPEDERWSAGKRGHRHQSGIIRFFAAES